MLPQNLKAKVATAFLPLSQNNQLVSNLLLFLLFLFIPFQLGKHFWPSFAYVLGQRVDYLSPTLYLSDLPIIFLFCFYGSGFVKRITKWFWILLLLLSIGIFFSPNPSVGWYGLLKLFEFVFIGWVIAKRKNDIYSFLYWAFFLDICLEGMLSIQQFLLQHSVGGIWYFFGERAFSASTPGIANATIHGQLILRPYGTFSHPNVLAGFLVIALLFFLTIALFEKRKLYRLTAILLLVLGTGILFLTLSRVAIVIWIGLLLVGLSLHFGKKIGLLVASFVGLCISMLMLIPIFSGRFLDIATYGESIDLRFLLQQAAVAMVLKSPILGVGFHNFLPALPSFLQGHMLFGFLQPVHNIFLLVLAETGLVGFVSFIFLLVMAFANNLRIVHKSTSLLSFFSLLSLSAICLIGLTDHYSLTLQQGQLLFAIVLGLSFSHGTIQVWPFLKNLLRIPSIK